MKDVIEFDNSLPSDFGMYVVNRPDIPAPEWDFEEVEVPGRDGNLTLDKKRYKNIEIPIEFNYIGKEEEWAQKWRAAKKAILRCYSLQEIQKYCQEIQR